MFSWLLFWELVTQTASLGRAGKRDEMPRAGAIGGAEAGDHAGAPEPSRRRRPGTFQTPPIARGPECCDPSVSSKRIDVPVGPDDGAQVVGESTCQATRPECASRVEVEGRGESDPAQEVGQVCQQRTLSRFYAQSRFLDPQPTFQSRLHPAVAFQAVGRLQQAEQITVSVLQPGVERLAA